jgi:hypothetical protein
MPRVPAGARDSVVRPAARRARVTGDPGWRGCRSRHACSTYSVGWRREAPTGAPGRRRGRRRRVRGRRHERIPLPAQRRRAAPRGGARRGHRMTLYPESQDHAGGRVAACAGVDGELAYLCAAIAAAEPPSPSTPAWDGRVLMLGAPLETATLLHSAGGHQRYPGFDLAPGHEEGTTLGGPHAAVSLRSCGQLRHRPRVGWPGARPVRRSSGRRPGRRVRPRRWSGCRA